MTGAAAETQTGTDGNDWLYSSSGSDTLIGGPGNDRYYLTGFGDVVVEEPGEGNDEIVAPLTPFVFSNYPNVEDYIYTGTEPLTATGNDGPNIISISAYGTGANQVDAKGGDDTINGFVGNEKFWGGEGRDYIEGQAGSDEIHGGSGNDLLVGDGINTNPTNFGNDTLYGDDGDDNISGGKGEDLIDGGAGNDRLDGDGATIDAVDGDDVITGGDGSDELSGGAGNDKLDGGNGLDVLVGGSGADLMVGGKDDDTYFVDNANDRVVEADEPLQVGQMGGDLVRVTNLCTYTLPDNVENLDISGDGCPPDFAAYGSSGDNSMSGGADGGALYGLEGNDTLTGGNASVTLVGGPGNDVYNVYSAGTTVTELPGEGIDKVSVWVGSFTPPGSLDYELPANVEMAYVIGSTEMRIIGSVDDNTLTGTPEAETIVGNGGSDTIVGNDGDDVLVGDTGATATASIQPQSRQKNPQSSRAAAAGNDSLDGGPGTDTAVLSGLRSEYLITYNAKTRTYTVADTVTGRDGTDAVRNVEFFKFSDGTRSLAHLMDVTLSGSDGNDKLVGNIGYDELYGSGGNDSLSGLAGDDLLDGGTGADTMTGGDGSDSYVVDNARDRVKENARPAGGIDTVYTDLPSYTLPSNVENLVYTGDTRFTGRGNKSANNLSGGPSDDLLDGRQGIDVMTGKAGNDSYVVDSPADLVNEEPDEGIDQVSSSVTITTLNPNVEALSLAKGNINGTGNALDNVITGSSGQNILSGGDGADTLIGGLGNDTFYGETAASAGNDADTISYADAKKGVIFNLGLTVAAQNTGGAGTDRIYEVSGIENLTGSRYNDTLTGNTGANEIRDLEGNDVISGLGGPDILIGNAGMDQIDCGDDSDADRVVYLLATDSPVGALRDQIAHFTPGTDQIDLSGIDADTTVDGNQAFLWGGSTPAAHSVWHVISGDDVILRGDVDGLVGADFEVLIKGITALEEADLAL